MLPRFCFALRAPFFLVVIFPRAYGSLTAHAKLNGFREPLDDGASAGQDLSVDKNGTDLLEIAAGSMSILRIGPVTIPIYSMVRIAMKSEMLLVLREPRLEVQTTPGAAAACEIVDVWVGEERPNVSSYGGGGGGRPLGVIRPGEKLQAILLNQGAQLRNANVVVEGDAARVVHWGLDCPSKQDGGCAACRWRTQCRHEDCERSWNTEAMCRVSREEIHARRLALSTGTAEPGQKSGGLWRPWNPLSR